jgi:hypothetical protein
LLRYIPENRSSKGGNWNVSIEKLTTRLKNKTCANPQSKNLKRAMNLD